MVAAGGLYWLVMSSFVLLAVPAQYCPQPQNGPANTVLTSGDGLKATFPDRFTVTWECEVGYVMEGGSPRQKCMAGTWNPEVVTLICDRKVCGLIPDPDNGRVDYPVGNQFGDKAVITCNAGYSLVGGQKELSCGPDGNWMGRFGKCEAVKCGRPADIVNGSYSPVQDNYDHGAVVTYECDNDFTLNGERSLDCQPDEKFHPAPPTCISLATTTFTPTATMTTTTPTTIGTTTGTPTTTMTTTSPTTIGTTTGTFTTTMTTTTPTTIGTTTATPTTTMTTYEYMTEFTTTMTTLAVVTATTTATTLSTTNAADGGDGDGGVGPHPTSPGNVVDPPSTGTIVGVGLGAMGLATIIGGVAFYRQGKKSSPKGYSGKVTIKDEEGEL